MALTLLQMKAQFQDPMRQGIVDMLWRASSIMKRLFFVPAAGLAYKYNKQTALPGVGFRNLNGTFTATAGTINPGIESLSILGGKIQTDSVLRIVRGEGVRANEIARQMEAAGKFYDKTFFNGDPAVTANSFYGLKGRLLTANTNLITQATNGAKVTWEKAQETLAAVNGGNSGKLLAMNQTNRINLINDALADNAGKGYVDKVITTGDDGKPKTTWYFDGAEILEIGNDETETAILGWTETCGTGTTCSSIYAMRLGGSVDEQGVQGLSGLPSGEDVKVSGPFDMGEYVLDVVQMVAGMGVFGGYEAARLQGTKAA